MLKAIFFFSQLGGKATRAGFDSAYLKKANEPKELDLLPPHNHALFPRINCRLLANEKTDGDYNV